MVIRLTAEYPVKRVCQVLDYRRSSYGGPSKGERSNYGVRPLQGWPLPGRPMGIAVSQRNCDARAGG